MDLQSRVEPLFDVLGQTVTVDDVTMTAIVTLPEFNSGPWADESQQSPMMTVNYDDLNDNDLFPLDDPEVEIDEVTYRVIASGVADGLVDIILQEA